MTMAHALPYKRLVVKVSGESLGSPTDPSALWNTVKGIVDGHALGVDLALVVGGGNLVRGDRAACWGVDRAQLDRSGMIATGLNAWNLAMLLRASGIATSVFGRGPCERIELPYSTQGVREAIDRREVVIIAGGMGVPGISTDVAACHLAGEIRADAVVMSKFGVDGVYDRDPAIHPNTARRIRNVDASEALRRGLNIMDKEALILAIETNTQIRVIGADEPGNLSDVLNGATIGSTVHPR